MREAYGVPVVGSVEEFPAVLEHLGIRPWRQVREPMDLEIYRTGELTTEVRKEVERFAPRGEAMFLETPDGKPFTGFRSVGKDWACVFALVPDPGNRNAHIREWLVPVVVEWKHGAGIIAITPPCGVPKKGESLVDCGRREFLEETGFELDGEVKFLMPAPLAVSGRQTTQQYQPCLGSVKEPVAREPSKLDANEYLKLILVPLPVWLKAIEAGLVRESSAISTTYLALRKLGLLQFTYSSRDHGIPW